MKGKPIVTARRCFAFAALLSLAAYAAQDDEVYRVSLVELIAQGASYERKLVEVSGFLVLEDGDEPRLGTIYLSRDDAKYEILQNGILIEIPTSLWQSVNRIDKRFVTARGRFSTTSSAGWGLFSGTLTEVTLLENKLKAP